MPVPGKFTKRYPGYDAVLDTDRCSPRNNADLTLTMRLGFRQINPMAGADTGTYHDSGDPAKELRQIVKWKDGEWAAWKRNFCRSAQDFWDKKFWLDNRTGDFPFQHGTEIYIPNIFCRFELIGNDDTLGTHHVAIDVVRLADSENFFQSNSRLFDSKDLVPYTASYDSKNRPIMQRAHVHEVGHLLGLGHVAIGKPGCPADGNTNLTPCYGVNDEDKHSIMGAGMRLDAAHAAAWVKAFNDLAATPASAIFRPSLTPPIYAPPIMKTLPVVAVMSHIYPRNIAEFEAGARLKALKRGR